MHNHKETDRMTSAGARSETVALEGRIWRLGADAVQ